MSYTLKLKLRKVKNNLLIPVEQIQSILDTKDREKLWETFEGLSKLKPVIHDKEWLEMIINWIPEHGMPFIETSRWLKLAVKVSELDDTTETELELSQKHINLIWDRLTSSEFKLRNQLSSAFAEFILEFQDTTKKTLISDEDELEE